MAGKSAKAVAALTGSDRFRPVTGLMFRTVENDRGGEVMIIPPTRGLAQESSALLTFEGSGKQIWELLDGRHSVTQIAAVLVVRYQVESEEAERDVKDFLIELLARGLIEK